MKIRFVVVLVACVLPVGCSEIQTGTFYMTHDGKGVRLQETSIKHGWLTLKEDSTVEYGAVSFLDKVGSVFLMEGHYSLSGDSAKLVLWNVEDRSEHGRVLYADTIPAYWDSGVWSLEGGMRFEKN